MRENLKKLRIQNELTQIKIAEQIGIEKRQYQALEAGTSYGSVPVWEKLRDILKAPSIDYLLEQPRQPSDRDS